MSPALREQVDAVSVARRWSFGEAMRVAAERLVENEAVGGELRHVGQSSPCGRSGLDSRVTEPREMAA